MQYGNSGNGRGSGTGHPAASGDGDMNRRVCAGESLRRTPGLDKRQPFSPVLMAFNL
jgi:hypothetical protein